MSDIRWRRARETYSRTHSSGGTLKVPKTPVERLMLMIKQRRLKADYYRRQERDV